MQLAAVVCRWGFASALEHCGGVWIIPHPNAELRICVFNIARDVYSLSGEDAHAVSLSQANIAVFITLIQNVCFKWVVDARHYSPIHSVNLVCSQRTLAS